MRVPSFARTTEVGFNMTPMIDVVFQLIIFFLVSSHLAKQEVHIKLPLPSAESGEKATDEEKPHLTINVLADGTLHLAGRAISPVELQARLLERRQDLGEDVEVRIRSDRTVPYRHVEPIMLACARAGVWNVTYAVYRKEDLPR